MYKSKTYAAIPPGWTVKEQLEYRGMSQKELASRMDLSEKHISHLLNGETILTPEVANRLERVLGIDTEFWLNLEAIYRADIIKVQDENAMTEDIEIAKKYPYAEMANYGWVEKTKNEIERIKNLRKFFEINNLALLESDNFLPKIACRKLSFTQKSDIALLVWTQEAKREARKIEVKQINLQRLAQKLQIIRKMTTLSPEIFCMQLKDILASCGIAVIFIPHLNGSGLQGATFLDGKKIVLGITTRMKYADIFWFSLFHELGHIINGHFNMQITNDCERQADDFAKNTLIPCDFYNDFLNAKKFSKDDIINFADKMQIDTSIVLGRLQKENFIKYDCFNDLKKQYVIM